MANEALLAEWFNIKDQIKELEEREEEIKDQVRDKLNEDGEFSAGPYEVKLRTTTRLQISKSGMPEDIYKKYCRPITINSLYLTKNKRSRKKKRTKKSPRKSEEE